MNKVAFITGGSRGIGLSLSQLLLEGGYDVFSISRSHGEYSHPRYHQLKFDLSQLNDLPRFIEQLVADHSVPDLLINNAGYGTFSSWDNFPDSEIHRQLDVLCKAPILICGKIVPLMAEKNRGVVVNLSSLATLYPLPFMPLYNAGKSALSAFTYSLMLEYKNCPVLIDFRMGDVRTSFNVSATRVPNRPSTSLNKAWDQIENQLHHSIPPEKAAELILHRVRKGKSGTFYGGTSFHGYFLPLVNHFLPQTIKNRLIRSWYGI
jgi:short-subunit dehydrogenase